MISTVVSSPELRARDQIEMIPLFPPHGPPDRSQIRRSRVDHHGFGSLRHSGRWPLSRALHDYHDYNHCILEKCLNNPHCRSLVSDYKSLALHDHNYKGLYCILENRCILEKNLNNSHGCSLDSLDSDHKASLDTGPGPGQGSLKHPKAWTATGGTGPL